jgi:hypothetical protein
MTLKAAEVKEKIRQEMIEYALNVVYLALVFATFTVYRRLLLAAYHIAYTNYFVAVIEALILGKVIMIGSIFRLGRGLEAKPLIWPALYKTVVFTVFVALFKLVEHGVRGLVKGEGFTAGLVEMLEKGPHEILANALIVFAAFIPFFAVKELGRTLGQKKLAALFFHKRVSP